jgi:aconitate decarboxylase
MRDPIERLAQHATLTAWSDLPAAAIAAAKIFLLDTIGVAVAGSAAPYADRLRQAAARWGTGEEAAVLGAALRLPAPAAALVNAFQAHNQEFDCVHEGAVVHPLATILAATLAFAERQGGVGGRDLLAAIVLGVDVATAIGMASRARMRFFRPATAGIFGATAAAGRLAGLDQAALLDAFGLAYGQAAGTMQAHVEGKPSLALQIGTAARAALNAVDLAAAGFPSAHEVLEGAFGYFRLMEGEWEIAPLLAELGRIWRICELSHKPFPSGRATHGGIDGLQRLMAQGVAAESVASVRLLAPPLIHQLVGRPYRSGMSPGYARLCFPYVGALTLLGGTVGLDDFTPARLAEASLAELARRIEVVIDDNPDRNALGPQRVVLLLHSGETKEVAVADVLGSPANPLSRERHLAKFRCCWQSGALPLEAAAGERLIDLVDALEDCPDVTLLARLAAAPTSRAS